jgi:hypothetical protein
MTEFGKFTPVVIYRCKIIIMRYKTITLSPDSKITFCSTESGEKWTSLEDALNDLAKDGWEIDQVINKTIVKLQNQEQLLLNQPILILKNKNLS